MNIIDVMRTGRRHRRKIWRIDSWAECSPHRLYSFSREDILADDWELIPLLDEAPKMVKKWLWVFRYRNSNKDVVTCNLLTEEEFKRFNSAAFACESIVSFEKIPGTEMLRPE